MLYDLTHDARIERRQPALRVRAVALDQLTHEIHRRATTGDHRKLQVKAFEIELTHDALMSLLHQEPARARLELLLDEPKLPRGEPETVAVVGRIRIGIREEHLGRGLLDDGAADRTCEDIA